MKDILDDYEIGKIVTLFAMDCMAEIHESICLDISHPKSLQILCWEATKDAPNAYFDDGEIYGWIRPFGEIGVRFTHEFLPKVHHDDQKPLKFWFRNAYNGLQQDSPIKDIWTSAFRWAWHLEEPIADISMDEVNLIKDFWAPVKKSIYADEYEDLKDSIASCCISDHDEDIKAKFHLNLLGDSDYVFQNLDFIREGHLLIKQWQTIKKDSALQTALQKLPYAWWDANPQKRKYLNFDIRQESAFMVGELIK